MTVRRGGLCKCGNVAAFRCDGQGENTAGELVDCNRPICASCTVTPVPDIHLCLDHRPAQHLLPLGGTRVGQ